MGNEVRTPSVSEIHFTSIRPRGGLIGFASFVLDDTYAVGGIGVHTRLGRDGIRLLYPDKRLPDGTIIQLFYPLTRTVGEAIELAVFQDIQRKMNGGRS